MDTAPLSPPEHPDAGTLVRTLVDARAGGSLIAGHAGALSPASAYAVQARVFGKGNRVAGWKLALTSAGAQAAFDTTTPVAGRLRADDLVANGATVRAPSGSCYAEAEIAVTLATDLPASAAPFPRDRIAAAIGAVHGAIELAASRFADDDLSLPLLIADNAMADRLVVGHKLADQWDERFATLPVTLTVGDAAPVAGSSAAVLGDPLSALLWLAHWCAEQGIDLRAGQIVSLGSCTGVTPVAPGDAIAAQFDGFPAATVRLIDKQPGEAM